MACFNEPKYLKKMLESIKTYISDYSQIQVLITDDCSPYPKEYQELVEEYNQYFICKYFKTKENSGPAIARNLSLSYSTGDFVAFVDDDDEIVDDILKYCDENYDMISTKFNIYKEEIVENDSIINPIYGIVYKNAYLKKYNLQLPQMRYGCEDSIFRAISFLLTKNIKFEDISFYKRNYREDSNFTKTVEPTKTKKSKYNKTIESFGAISDLTYICNLDKELDKYSLYFTEEIKEKILKILDQTIYGYLLEKTRSYSKTSYIVLRDCYVMTLYLTKKYFVKRKIKSKELLQLFSSIVFFNNKYVTIDSDYLIIELKEDINDEDMLNFYSIYFPHWKEIFDLSIPMFFNIKSIRDLYSINYYNYIFSNKDIKAW